MGEDADVELEGLQERSLGCVHCDGQADGLEAHEVVSLVLPFRKLKSTFSLPFLFLLS